MENEDTYRFVPWTSELNQLWVRQFCTEGIRRIETVSFYEAHSTPMQKKVAVVEKVAVKQPKPSRLVRGLLGRLAEADPRSGE